MTLTHEAYVPTNYTPQARSHQMVMKLKESVSEKRVKVHFEDFAFFVVSQPGNNSMPHRPSCFRTHVNHP